MMWDLFNRRKKMLFLFIRCDETSSSSFCWRAFPLQNCPSRKPWKIPSDLPSCFPGTPKSLGLSISLDLRMSGQKISVLMELSTGGSTLPELWEAIFQLASLDVLRAISCFELNAFIDTQAIYVMLPGPSLFQHDHGRWLHFDSGK